MARVRAATGTREPDATLLRRLAIEGAEAELEAGRNRRVTLDGVASAVDLTGSPRSIVSGPALGSTLKHRQRR